MATWIGHLRIAEGLLAHFPALDAAAFALGSVGPDSGIPNADWSAFDPPTEVTHLKRPVGRFKLDDLAFYRRYLRGVSPDTERARYSYLLGYFLHLVTDNLWADLIGRPTRARHAEEFRADPQFIWEVKKDWYALDDLYVRTHPDALFWRVFMTCGYPDDYLPFLPPAAVRHQLDYIRRRYSDNTAPIDRPFAYLNAADMDAFIADTVARLASIVEFLAAGRADSSKDESAAVWGA